MSLASAARVLTGRPLLGDTACYSPIAGCIPAQPRHLLKDEKPMGVGNLSGVNGHTGRFSEGFSRRQCWQARYH